MKTAILMAQDPETQARALELLEKGGLVAFPTDTVYGLGALAFNAEAVGRIYPAKDRPAEKAIPILIADVSDLAKVTLEVPQAAARLASRFWPGPLTLILGKHPSLPRAVSAGHTVGVRIPDHPVARGLLRAAGPMAVTSANLSGLPSPSTAQDVHAQLGGRIPLIIDGGQTPGGVPSTVVDCSGAKPRILRPGPVTEDEIRLVLGLDL